MENESSSSSAVEEQPKEKMKFEFDEVKPSSSSEDSRQEKSDRKKQAYVVGFVFSEDLSHVALIKKNRPDWQKGRYNGIGGEINEGESVLDAMIREFQEEADVDIQEWKTLGVSTFDEATVHFLTARISHEIFETIAGKSDEEIHFVEVRGLIRRSAEKNFHEFNIEDLSWLIPLALNEHRNLNSFARFEA